jgi:transposase
MARRALHPNAENCSCAELDVAIRAARGKSAQVRLLAIKSLLVGADHALVARIHDITRQTLLVWVKAFNRQGIDGLTDKARPGRPRAINAKHTERLTDLLHHPDQAQFAHWTAKKFHGYLSETLQIECGYRTVVRWMHEQNFVLKVPRPWSDRQDEKARQHWRKQLSGLLEDPTVELWYMDEMGVEGDPRPRQRWALKGSQPRITKNGDHLRMNVTGMICPRTGEAFLLEFTHNDRDVFQAFLDEANRHVQCPRARNVLICDNASWHKCNGIEWGKFEVLYLPPYSPDFNPIELLWLTIKRTWFSDFVAKDLNALIEHLDKALNWAMDRQSENQITCAIH